MKNLWGATVIAVIVYFCMSFFSDLWFEQTTRTTIAIALWSGTKAAIFGVIFHYAHSGLAHMLGWYDYDPELDGARAPAPVKDAE